MLLLLLLLLLMLLLLLLWNVRHKNIGLSATTELLLLLVILLLLLLLLLLKLLRAWRQTSGKQRLTRTFISSTHVRRSSTLRVRRRNICTSLQQQPNNRRLSLGRREMQRRAALLVLRRGVCTRSQKSSYYVLVPPCHSGVQRAVA